MKIIILISAFLLSSVTFACSSGSLCPGARVMDPSNRVGSVVEVLSNGKIKILIDMSYFYSYHTKNELSKAVKCHQGICVGDRVNDTAFNLRHSVGKAVEVFENGKLKVLFDGRLGYSIRSKTEIGKGVQCFENLCAGDWVGNEAGDIGEALEVFDNGRAKIIFHNRSYNDVVPISSLNY